MTKQEIEGLKDGTLLFNGYTETEGVFRIVNGEPTIVIFIPVDCMKNSARNYDERPESWVLMED